MNHFYLFMSGLMLLACGCVDDDNADAVLEVPSGYSIDLNEDGQDDFDVTYQQFVWDGINSSGVGWFGKIVPREGSSIIDSLNSPGVTNYLPEAGTTLSAALPEALRWNAFRGGVIINEISLGLEFSEQPPFIWNEVQNQSDRPHFLGLRFQNTTDTIPVFGWLEFESDVITGRINILNKGFALDSVVVGE